MYFGHSNQDMLCLQLVLAIERLGDHGNGWDYRTAIPTLLGAILSAAFGFSTALFLDHLKSKREAKDRKREKLEDELASISKAVTLLAFNVELLTHTAMQQIIPHYEASENSCNVLAHACATSSHPTHDVFQPYFQGAMERCPPLNLKDTDHSDSIGFLINTHADLIKQSGWINSFRNDLAFIIAQRNRLIDKATIDAPDLDIDFSSTTFHAKAQLQISSVEVGNCYQLFNVLLMLHESLFSKISENYKNVSGPKLKAKFPPVLDEVRMRLREICHATMPELLEP